MILLEKCLKRRDVWARFDRGRGFCLLFNKDTETCKPVLLQDIKNNLEVHMPPLTRCILQWLKGQRGIISTTFTAREKMPVRCVPCQSSISQYPSTPVEQQESTQGLKAFPLLRTVSTSKLQAYSHFFSMCL